MIDALYSFYLCVFIFFNFLFFFFCFLYLVLLLLDSFLDKQLRDDAGYTVTILLLADGPKRH